MNVGGGNRFALGKYYPDNETWVTDIATATIDSGPNSNWEYAGASPALVARARLCKFETQVLLSRVCGRCEGGHG